MFLPTPVPPLEYDFELEEEMIQQIKQSLQLENQGGDYEDYSLDV